MIDYMICIKLTKFHKCVVLFSPFKKLLSFLDIEFIYLSKLTSDIWTRQIGPPGSIEVFDVDKVKFKFSIFQKMFRQD